ncbi:MAG: hypothetical protein NWF09_00645 [Candidatus Bathyarchaeota archaeon]|nr:hypothetical protein [Candidatus Bathyarchaeota archaeon]
MMRTIEVLIAIIIITGAFIISSFYAVLPWPRQVSPLNIKRLALTTLQTLDSDYSLSLAAFDVDNASLWGDLQVALSASLPPNIVYNLTVYEVGTGEDGSELYVPKKSISNAESLGLTTDSSSYMVASSNVTFNVIPEKIGEREGGGTLYILNCSDAPGWWITGYTAHSLAEDLYKLLSPYFVNTVMVQNTEQLARILNNQTLQGETVRNAVIINTCGEAVPIPSAYCQAPYNANSYARYFYFLGEKVREYNWTWCSIVGYPFYYVSNTVDLAGSQNGWGIYGMVQTGGNGSIAFLRGLDNQTYDTRGSPVTDREDRANVTLTQTAIDACNYYGIYPSVYQTSTRALTDSIRATYNLTVGIHILNPTSDGYNPGTLYNHVFHGSSTITGSFLALGLTRTPDIRLTAIGLLSYYKPRLYRSEYTAYGTSRLVILQLGLVGGV